MPDLEAVAICTPPGVRYGHAREALDAGKHVLLEKPPFPTTMELTAIAAHASSKQRVIFTTWHSQYNAAVEETRKRLVGQRIARLAITWKEDVRRWHPGQAWIWEAGGFGVFDPGINALSILTTIMPGPVFLKTATLVTPRNKDMPIAAQLVFWSPVESEGSAGAMTADFDWRQQGEQSWNFAIETAAGTRLDLTGGGSRLAVDGREVVSQPPAEYEAIYGRFGTLLSSGESLVDPAPLGLVADAFMVGKRVDTEPFED